MMHEPTVFVVDDAPSIRMALRRIIATAGWPVHTFASVAAFRQACHSAQQGCVLFDLRTAEQEGGVCLAQHAAQNSAMPLILMLIEDMDGMGEAHAAAIGAAAVLVKPFTSQQLLACLAQVLAGDDAS
jgi:FixJ family two-component response regulator